MNTFKKQHSVFSNVSHFLKRISVVFGVVTVSSCAPGELNNVESTKVQVVKLAQVKAASPHETHRFPAEVSAVKTLDASFQVAGRIVESNLLTGSIIKKGDVIARLDATPFEQRFSESEARLNQAARNANRIQNTYDKGLASKSDLDNAKTELELAEIALSKAKQDLSYTVIKAPFDAQVSERLLENNSFVREGEVVGRLQDVSRLHFTINVPERLISQHKEDSSINATARLIALPQDIYDLKYVEHSTQPDPVTQTYRVVFSAEKEQSNLPPGARAEVTVAVISNELEEGLSIPFSALDGTSDEKFLVWKYSKENSSVSSVMVDVLDVQGGFAVVDGELEKDSFVVAAGVTHMRNGLTVTPYSPES